MNIGRTKKERYDNEVEESLQRQVVMNNRDIQRFMQAQSLNSNVGESAILKHPMIVNFRSQQRSMIKEEIRMGEQRKMAFEKEDKNHFMRY